jgi:hypothetical protein
MVFMKSLGPFPLALNDVMNDARKLLATLRDQSIHEPTNPSEAIKILEHFRQEIYESLNQIQHEYLIIRAAMWLQSNDTKLNRVSWFWNPRQTGDKKEPDLAAEQQSVRLISAEVTASRNPVGVIDTRMMKTLLKLNPMLGNKFYFVRTESMYQRAQTKVSKNKWNIKVVLL